MHVRGFMCLWIINSFQLSELTFLGYNLAWFISFFVGANYVTNSSAALSKKTFRRGGQVFPLQALDGRKGRGNLSQPWNMDVCLVVARV